MSDNKNKWPERRWYDFILDVNSNTNTIPLTIQNIVKNDPAYQALAKVKSIAKPVSIEVKAKSNTYSVSKLKGLIDDKGNRLPITGIGLQSYMKRNNLNHVVDIIKTWKRDKLKCNEWEHLVIYLSSLNFEPYEVLDYAIKSIKTKKKFFEHRIVREYKKQNQYNTNEFIKIYKQYSKQPLKVMLGSNELKNWCKQNNIKIDSEENLRQISKILIKLWNDNNKNDKIPEKRK